MAVLRKPWGVLDREQRQEVIRLLRTAFLSNRSISLRAQGRRPRDIFFLLRESGQLRAVGSLRPVRVRFRGEAHGILGVSGVVAAEKGKGFGTRIMGAIRAEAARQRKMALGFCRRENAGFYRKCGFSVVPGAGARFAAPGRFAMLHDRTDSDVIYYPKNAALIRAMQKRKGVVRIPGRRW